LKELIKADNLSVQLKKTRIFLVKDVSFSISPGESLVILGQSGSGKTMTCNSIMGLLDPRRFQVTGSLSVGNRNLLSLSRKEKQQLYGGILAMIPQNPMTAFNPSVRIGRQMKETLRLHSQLPSSALEGRVKQALLKSGLDEPDRVYRSYPLPFPAACFNAP
jgi:nickel transport system ATP-binding protein